MKKQLCNRLLCLLFSIITICSLTSCMGKINEPIIKPPSEVSNLISRSTTEGNLVLNWENPSSSDFEYVIISYLLDGKKQSIQVESGTNTYTIYGLKNKVPFTTTLKTMNKTGIISSGLKTIEIPTISKLDKIIIDIPTHSSQISENDTETIVTLSYPGLSKDIDIRYSTDGSDVTETSDIYSDSSIIKPIKKGSKLDVKAKAYRQGVSSSESEKIYYKVENTFYSLNTLKAYIEDQMSYSKLGPDGDYNYIKLGENLTDLSGLFKDSSFNGDISAWDVSNVTNMNHMFANATKFNKPINDWDVSNVTDMYYMFDGATSFNQPLNDWDVSNVTDMFDMFKNAKSFNQSINDWDVSKVSDMIKLFSGAESFNQPLNDWDVSNVTNMQYLFENAISFNQPLNNWDVSSVKSMLYAFKGTTAFNESLNNWDVSSVTEMKKMFYQATSFNKPLNKWNVSNVSYLNSMFEGAIAFNQSINDWNVSNVKETNSMFEGAVAFNQPLDNWKLNSLIYADEMFKSCSIFNQNLTIWQENLPKKVSYTNIIKNALLMTEENLPDNLKSNTIIE